MAMEIDEIVTHELDGLYEVFPVFYKCSALVYFLVFFRVLTKSQF